MILINTSVTTDIMVVIPLLFTIYLACKNVIASPKKTNYYILAVILTLTELVLEIATEIFQAIDSAEFTMFHMAANVIGFSLMPVVALVFAYLHNEKLIQYKIPLSIPLIINAFIVLCSVKTGWIFTISTDNLYARGEYFWIQALCSLFYFLVLVGSDLYVFRDNNNDEKLLLGSIYFLPVIGIAVQLALPDLLLIWGSISISLLLYYIFLRELQFKYDALTEIQNRAAFKKEMKACSRLSKVLIAVFDLNDLKKINDKSGHVEGDHAIKEASKIIKDCFSQYGTPFRIGGDEFCVICKSISEIALKDCFELLERKTDIYNLKAANKLSIAYGYSIFDSNHMNDIYDAFAIADQHMYENKSLWKATMKER